MKHITIELVQRHFGAETTLSPRLRAGCLIKARNGRAVALQAEFESVNGDKAFRVAAKQFDCEVYAEGDSWAPATILSSRDHSLRGEFGATERGSRGAKGDDL
jgi:hypothetical protein